MVMTMISQLFGFKNVKSSTELRSIGNRKPINSKTDDHYSWGLGSQMDDRWATNASDALRIPILAKAHTIHLNSGNSACPAFGQSTNKNKYRLSESNPFGVESASDLLSEKAIQPAVNASVSSPRASIISKLGVYSKSDAYSLTIKKLLANSGLSIEVLGPSDMTVMKKTGRHISAWIIDLSDEEDCPVLDVLLDKYADVSSLFLFEKILSSKCIAKLRSFVESVENSLTA